jgi:GT2 family glycosyltransferase
VFTFVYEGGAALAAKGASAGARLASGRQAEGSGARGRRVENAVRQQNLAPLGGGEYHAASAMTAAPDAPLISVIIPVYNDREGLRVCLEALAKQTWPAGRWEALVVDNASREPILDVVAPFPFVRALTEPLPGSYAARNRGLSEARGTLLAFTDADCRPRPDWLEAGARALAEHAGPVVLAGRVEVLAQDPEHTTLAEEYELALAFTQRSNATRKHFSVTANMFTTRAAFDRAGSFNPQLKSGGDKEWGQRAFSRGVPVVYCDAAAVEHPARRELRELCKKRARQAGGLLTLTRQKYPAPLAFLLVAGKQAVPKLLVPAAKDRRGLVAQATRYAKIVAAANVARAYGLVEVFRLQWGKSPQR